MTIVALSLNPTIDVSGQAELIRPTHKIRTSHETYDPGGGGVNVARVITELGGNATVICPAGGFSGSMLDALLGAAAIRRQIVPIAGNTRISMTIFEKSSGYEYRFTPTGPKLSAGEADACVAAVRGLEFDYLVASGSVPPGAPEDILVRIGEIAAAKGAKFVLDSSGPGLSVTLGRVPVHLVKPSFGELEALTGRDLDDKAARDAAVELVARGHAEIVVVTMGAAGALLVSKDIVLRMWSPRVKARSAVGAGDSFVGAMTLALSEGRAIEDALIYAVAAGAATALTQGTKLCSRGDVHRLYADLRMATGADRRDLG